MDAAENLPSHSVKSQLLATNSLTGKVVRDFLVLKVNYSHSTQPAAEALT